MAWTRFGKKKDMPGGLWIKCESCGGMLFRKEFEQKLRVCGSCGYYKGRSVLKTDDKQEG